MPSQTVLLQSIYEGQRRGQTFDDPILGPKDIDLAYLPLAAGSAGQPTCETLGADDCEEPRTKHWIFHRSVWGM